MADQEWRGGDISGIAREIGRVTWLVSQGADTEQRCPHGERPKSRTGVAVQLVRSRPHWCDLLCHQLRCPVAMMLPMGVAVRLECSCWACPSGTHAPAPR